MISRHRALALLAAGLALASSTAAAPPERVRVRPDGNGFTLAGRPFVPWGFNYDHDGRSRLIEDYWDAEWPKIEEDFAEMKALGANVVRIHLQVAKFLRGPAEPDPHALDQLSKLLDLAGRNGLYLDLTGLGCYRRADVPKWYDALDEPGRWAAQRVFWKAVAGRCKGHPSVFFYDLMNEPVVAGGKRKPGDWLGGEFGGFCFVQFINLEQGQRTRPEIAREWVASLTKAVREADPDGLVTVGMVDWSLDRPGLTSGFVPAVVAGPLDLLCVHLYPEKGKLDAAFGVLKGFREASGKKPLVVEETFPLKSGRGEHEAFLDRSRTEGLAQGWVGFYWGKTIAECRKANTISDAITAEWLESFRSRAKAVTGTKPAD